MDTRQVNEALTRYIKPQTSPLALKLCKSENDIPEGAQRPLRDLGYQVILCQAYGLARIHGKTLAVGREDQFCVGGAAVMGYIEKLPEGLPPVKPERCVGFGEYSHLVVAPLERATFEPEAVVVYGSPAQVCRLAQAVIFPTGQDVSANIGGAALCGAMAVQTIKSGECQFVLHCGGDRMFGGTQDYEVVFTIPWGRVEPVMKGLEDTHMMGFTYPIPVGIDQRPALPPIYAVPE